MTATLLPWLREPLARALALRGHALLLHGPSGVGQFELGVAIVQTRLCEAGEGARPCGACPGCRLLAARSHPDFRALLPEALADAIGWAGDGDDAAEGTKRAKPSREIRVDAVRDAIAWAQQTSARGAGKLLLIHPAQAMNAVTANALLKTLEEPPPSLRVVLCASDPELLLPTIRSRCQWLRVDPPPAADAQAWLRAQGVADADVLLAAAGGRPLDALALVGEGIDAAAWRAVPGRVARGDAGVFAGWAVPRVIDTLHKLCHDAMAAAAGGAPRYFGAVPAADLAALAAWETSLRRVARHDEHPWQAPLLVDALVIEAQQALNPSHGVRKRLDTLAGR